MGKMQSTSEIENLSGNLEIESYAQFVRLQLLHYSLNRKISFQDDPLATNYKVILIWLLRQRNSEKVAGEFGGR